VSGITIQRNFEPLTTNLIGASRQMQSTVSALASGTTLTSAAVNPAGSAISAYMGQQLRGMTQAYQDVANGLALLQTADGALGQIQGLIQSMYTLATQAANGSNAAVDRASIQSQIDQYTTEITSIANQTSFNGLNLLDGILGAMRIVDGPSPGQALSLSLGAMDAYSLGLTGDYPSTASFLSQSIPSGTLSGLSLLGASSTGAPSGSRSLGLGQYNMVVQSVKNATLNGSNINAASLTPTGSTVPATAGSIGSDWVLYDGTSNISVQVRITAGPSGTVSGVQYSVGGSPFHAATTDANGDYVLGGTGVVVMAAGITANSTSGATDTYSMSLTPASASLSLVDPSGVTLGTPTTVYGISTINQQVVVGDANTGQAVSVGYNSSTLFGLTAFDVTTANGTAPAGSPFSNPFLISGNAGNAATGAGGEIVQKATAPTGLSVMSYAEATAAQEALQRALQAVSAQRAHVGAWMDRLDQASTNVATSSRNLTASRAAIADTNVSSSTVALTQDKVHVQAGISMLQAEAAIPRFLLHLLP